MLKPRTVLEIVDSQQAFNEAISEGRLSPHEHRENYAGHYMYMGTRAGQHLFKHRDTRQYLP